MSFPRIARMLTGAALAALVAGGLIAASAGAAAPAGTVTARIGVGTEGAPVQFAGGQVWVLTRNGLLRVSPRTNRAVGRPLRLPGQPAGPPTGPACPEAPYGLAAGAGRLWAFGGSRVYRIDPRRGVVTGTIRLGRKGSVCVRDVAASGGRVYVLDAPADRIGQKRPPAARLVRYDARTLAAGFRYPAGGPQERGHRAGAPDGRHPVELRVRPGRRAHPAGPPRGEGPLGGRGDPGTRC